MEQFVRTKLLLGEQKIKKIFESKVTVVGLGAVGSFAVEILARVGVGNLTLVDFDVVQESNINRQLYALHSTVNTKKVELAKARVLDINPNCKVKTFDVFVNTDTLDTIFSETPDIVI
ncbi:MAG: ThiF family adenylyltransferase, partial [Elusimicrobia bacterium]|nr:ThiF family adenylyltransferase [Elusimicrobiota bacterium]